MLQCYAPRVKSTALHFLLLTFAGLVSRHQARVVAYLLEENRVLRELLFSGTLRRIHMGAA